MSYLKKFDSFILEYNETRVDTTILDLYETAKLIKAHCKNFRFTHAPIWRNTHQMDDFLLINPKLYHRKSFFSTNHYNLIFDNSRYWSQFPKRMHSIIGMFGGHNDAYGASRFRLIPFDGAKFGVANSSDFWFSFNYLKDKIDIKVNGLNSFFEDISKFFNIEPINDVDYNGFLEDMKLLSNLLRNKGNYIKIQNNNKFYEEYQKLIDLLYIELNKNRNILDILNDYLKPQDNDIQLVDYNTLINMSTKKDMREVWTDSKCILVHISKIKELKELI